MTWQPAAELHQLRMDAVERGHLDHPSIERAGRIAEAMLVVITAILRLAGIDAADADDDMRPIALRVSRPVAG